MSTTDLIECRQEILELWARLENTSIYRNALDDRIDFDIDEYWWEDSDGDNYRDQLVELGYVIGLNNINLHNVKKVRNRIAHNTTTATLRRLLRTRDALRAVHVKLEGYESFATSWAETQTSWTREQRATRARRHRLLNDYEATFGGVREHSKLPPSIRDSISSTEFNECRRIRDRCSHPAPPPSDTDVESAIEMTVSTRTNSGLLDATEADRRLQVRLDSERKRNQEREDFRLREVKAGEVRAQLAAEARAALELDRQRKIADEIARLAREESERRKMKQHVQETASTRLRVTELKAEFAEASDSYVKLYAQELPNLRNDLRHVVKSAFLFLGLVNLLILVWWVLSGLVFLGTFAVLVAFFALGVPAFQMCDERERNVVLHALRQEPWPPPHSADEQKECADRINALALTLSRLEGLRPTPIERILSIDAEHPELTSRYRKVPIKKIEDEWTRQVNHSFPGINTAITFVRFLGFSLAFNVAYVPFSFAGMLFAVVPATVVGMFGWMWMSMIVGPQYGRFLLDLRPQKTR